MRLTHLYGESVGGNRMIRTKNLAGGERGRVENATTPEEERAENDVCKLRADFNQSRTAQQSEMVTEKWNSNASTTLEVTGRKLTADTPLILLDFGEALSVFGATWVNWWFGGAQQKLWHIERHFLFGAGPLIHSSGATVIFIQINESCVNSVNPVILRICVDVGGSNVPILASRESLRKMKGPIDFREPSIAISSGISIQLVRTPSCHLTIPWGDT